MTISRRDFVAAGAAASFAPRFRTAARAQAAAPSDRLDPWIEVDPAALAHNVGVVRRLSERPILAVLKNNAYGLGLDLVARHLEPMSEIAGFAVVRADEALTLRDAGVRKPVLLMARAATEDVPELSARNIELCVTAPDDPARLKAAMPGGYTRPVQLYVDTGMSRMGIRWDVALPVVRELNESDTLQVTGSFMAFTEELEFDREQLRRFKHLTEQAAGENWRLGRLHAASSNAVYHLPEAHLDQVRPGIAIFGAYPSRPNEESAKAELLPAMRLRARVTRLTKIQRGDSVSYGQNYVAERPVWIATLPVGHADGYPRQAVDGARVLIGDRTYPVIGAVSASHTIIEVGDEPTVSIGDAATLLGPDVPEIHPNNLANAVGVSVYDLLMHLSPLLPRFEV